jgi:hypothetical protein
MLCPHSNPPMEVSFVLIHYDEKVLEAEFRNDFWQKG